MRLPLSVLTPLIVLTLLATTAQAADTTTNVELRDGEDAGWTVEVREPLDTAAEVQGFERVTGNISSSNSTENFRDRLNRTVAKASDRTGRDMRIADFSVSAEVQGLTEKWGVVRYSFTWEGFARTQGGDVAVDDVLSGYYLGEGDVLRIELPRGGEVAKVEPAPDRERDGVLEWRGPSSFAAGEPYVRVSVSGAGVAASDTATPTPGGAGSEGGVDFVKIFGVAIAVVVGAGFLLRRIGSMGESGAGADLEGPVPDEDRVLDLLWENDGRMRQGEVVDATDWSAAKVSNVTSALEEQGLIEKKKWGRENILVLKKDSWEDFEEEDFEGEG